MCAAVSICWAFFRRSSRSGPGFSWDAFFSRRAFCSANRSSKVWGCERERSIAVPFLLDQTGACNTLSHRECGAVITGRYASSTLASVHKYTHKATFGMLLEGRKSYRAQEKASGRDTVGFFLRLPARFPVPSRSTPSRHVDCQGADLLTRSCVGLPGLCRPPAADPAPAWGALSPELFLKVSNIDHYRWNPEAHAGSITPLYRPLPVTESVALPPDPRRASHDPYPTSSLSEMPCRPDDANSH